MNESPKTFCRKGHSQYECADRSHAVVGVLAVTVMRVLQYGTLKVEGTRVENSLPKCASRNRAMFYLILMNAFPASKVENRNKAVTNASLYLAQMILHTRTFVQEALQTIQPHKEPCHKRRLTGVTGYDFVLFSTRIELKRGRCGCEANQSNA